MVESTGRQERRKAGQELRKKVPRTSFAKWDPPADRRDPVEILVGQAASRMPDLVPVRYARMLSSEFAFFRGAAAVMASDLSYGPNTGITVQLAGDAHLANFGGYGSPERQFVFDVNDFDETLPGAFEWDLKRLVASFAIAGRHRGFSAAKRARMVSLVVSTYREAVQQFSQMSRMDVWYAHMSAEEVAANLDAKGRKQILAEVAKAQEKNSQRALAKLTTRGEDGNYQFLNNPPFLVRFADLMDDESEAERKKAIDSALTGYRRSLMSDRRALFAGYRVVDVARKVVGVGSVGTRCWVVLFVAEADDSDVLMLQMKQAEASVLEPYFSASRVRNHGQRVVEGQRMMQAASDILLGWTRIGPPGEEVDFYVRQMWDWKESADLDTMSVMELEIYARMCGWTLARAHCRSGDRILLAGYLGTGKTLDDALVEYAEAYADQNAKDYAAMQAAATAGRIEVAANGW